ncbi:MAG: hypothetical protein ABJB47_03350 [Actinomycetota bacterium]
MAMPGSGSGTQLHDQLAGWVADGLIDEGQAARIAAGGAGGDDAPPPAAPGPDPRRLPLVVEALGYLGAVLAVLAGFITLRQLWPSMPVGAGLAFAGGAAAVLLLAGIMLRIQGHPAFGRLRSALWLGSAASVAVLMGLVTGPGLGELSPVSGLLVTEAVFTAYAIALWLWSRATLQHLAVFAGLAALTGTGISQAWPGPSPWLPGLGVWILAAVWGAAVYRGYLAPQTAGYSAAGIGLLIGAQLTMGLAAGQVLAVATVAGLLAAGIALHRVLLLGLGALGAVTILPQTAVRYLPGGAGAAAAIFGAGVVILGVALWLARERAKA